uniref:Uncharacterized protein n=1 Tax=Arundo donax TaxID=35708 RepID=A0A0A9D8Y8_ARUDO
MKWMGEKKRTDQVIYHVVAQVGDVVRRVPKQDTLDYF